jgi:hypothetical protein
MIIGDGYIPYHIRVYVEAASAHDFTQFVKTATGLKHEFERAGRVDHFPEAVIERLTRLPGAAHVYPFGGYSAVLGALKMVRSFGARPCGMYGVVGTGPIADAIRKSFAEEGIALYPTVRTAADSSIESTMIDTQFRFLREFQIHFLRMRDRSHILRLETSQEDTMAGFLCSRPNRSRAEVAKRLFGLGRLVSVRIHGFSRYVRPEDYLNLLGHAQQVFIRHEEMRSMGRALGIMFPRGWQPTVPDDYMQRFAERLGTHEGGRRLVALAFLRTAHLYVPELGFVSFQVPETQRRAVSDTRFHGALIAQSFRFENYLPTTTQELESLGNTALQASYHGYEQFPPVYPEPTFTGTETWRV